MKRLSLLFLFLRI